MNLDETAICLWQAALRGNIFDSGTAVQSVSMGRRRTYMTHVAIICDVPWIQPLMPQVLICNERTIPAARLAALRAGLPTNAHLFRQRSAWSSTRVMVWIIGLLGKALAPFAADYTPIFLFDAARIHTPSAVFMACRRWGLMPVLIAAKLTWLLQPLDVRGFMPFKLHLHKAYQACRLRSPGGVVAVDDWLACVCAAIRAVLQGKCWASAFDATGFGSGQAGVGDKTKALLGAVGPLCVGATQPSADQLRICFPGRAKVPSAAIWKACEVAPLAKPKAMPKPASVVPAPPPAVGHRLGPVRPRPPPPAPGPRRSSRLAVPKGVAVPFAKAGRPLSPRPCHF